jgi:hypothetical protein
MAHVVKLTDFVTSNPVYVNLDMVVSATGPSAPCTLYMAANSGPPSFTVKENVGDIFGFNAN